MKKIINELTELIILSAFMLFILFILLGAFEETEKQNIKIYNEYNQKYYQYNK